MRRPSSHRRLGPWPLVVVFGLVAAAACGGDSDEESAATTSTSVTTTEGSPGPSQGTGPGSSPDGAPGSTGTSGPGASGTTAPKPGSPPATATTLPGGVTTTTATTGTGSPLGVGLWVLGLDGTGRRRLGTAGLAAWSPDGRRVAAASTLAITVFSLDDGHVESVVKATSLANFCLDWSAKGRLAWVGYSGDVWMADSDASSGDVVDSGRLPQGFSTQSGQLCRWAPDGSALAVGGQGLKVYSPDGTTSTTYDSGPDVRHVDGVVWAPDGSAVAAVERLAGDGEPSRIMVAPTSGAQPRRIDSPGGPVLRLAWPKGSAKLYVQTATGLYTVDPASGAGARLAGPCCGASLQVLPGGDFLGITTGEWTADTVALSGADGKQQRVLARADSPGGCSGSFFLHLRASPAGDRVAVTAPTKSGPRCDYAGPV